MKTDLWINPLVLWFDKHCKQYGDDKEINEQIRQQYIIVVNDQVRTFLKRVGVPEQIFLLAQREAAAHGYHLDILNDLFSTLH